MVARRTNYIAPRVQQLVVSSRETSWQLAVSSRQNNQQPTTNNKQIGIRNPSDSSVLFATVLMVRAVCQDCFCEILEGIACAFWGVREFMKETIRHFAETQIFFNAGSTATGMFRRMQGATQIGTSAEGADVCHSISPLIKHRNCFFLLKNVCYANIVPKLQRRYRINRNRKENGHA